MIALLFLILVAAAVPPATPRTAPAPGAATVTSTPAPRAATVTAAPAPRASTIATAPAPPDPKAGSKVGSGVAEPIDPGAPSGLLDRRGTGPQPFS